MQQEKTTEAKLLSSQQLKKLLAEDKLDAVLDGLHAISAAHQSPIFADKLALLSARCKAWRSQMLDGTADYGDLNISIIQIRKATLVLINDLPKEGQTTAPAKPKGILESRFKKQLFVGMIVSKLIVIAYILFHQSTGGFSKMEALATIALLLPVFAAYISAMLGDNLSSKYVDTLRPITEKYIRPELQRMAYILIPIYVVALLWVVTAKAVGFIQYEELNPVLALVESGFGIYVGKIIFAIFGDK